MQRGAVNSSIFELLFIPALIGLGLLGASFNDIFSHFNEPGLQAEWISKCFGFSIGLFLMGIWAMMSFLKYPAIFLGFKRTAKLAFVTTAFLIVAFTCLSLQNTLVFHLLFVLIMLIALILYLNSIWYNRIMKKDKEISG